MTSPADASLIEWVEGAPRSTLYGDTYYSATDGLEESRAVYLTGCGLPDRFAGRRQFTVAELGFGTGLNVLALIDLWRRFRPFPDARLHVFSVEGHPMSADDAARALARWPQMASLAGPLLAGWPRGRRGFHRIEWRELGVVLDLGVGDVEAVLADYAGKADAWFLDGFAPARNPAMWTREVLGAVVERSAPGARLASFTVAGSVRRTLEELGARVERAPGFGRKKQRLEAFIAEETLVGSVQAASKRIAVIGGGIGGASICRALRAEGLSPVLIEKTEVGAGASGNAAGLLTPRLDAGLGPVARLYAHCFARAVELVKADAPGAIITEGVVQLGEGERDARRFSALADWDEFGPGALSPLSPAALADQIGEETARPGLLFRDALVVEPKALLDAWFSGVETVPGEVADITPGPDGLCILDPEGRVLTVADQVVIAAGAGSTGLAPHLDLRPVAGQVSTVDAEFSGRAAAWGGYAVPTRNGFLFGATHRRGDAEGKVLDADHVANRGSLADGRPALAAEIAEAPLTGRASVRLATADHLPVIGPAISPDGGPEADVFLFTGFGGRGLCLAPALAEHLAAMMVGVASPLPASLHGLMRADRERLRRSTS